MNVKQMTLLAGLTFALAACAQRQTEVEGGDVEPADTALVDTAVAPPVDTVMADTGFAPPADTGFTEADTGFAETDTAMAGDTAMMSDTAMQQMGDTAAIESAAGGEVVGATLQATLSPPEGAPRDPGARAGGTNVSGTAFVTPADNGTSVQVQISGAQPGSTHPWHIHKGTCGNDQGVVGPAAAYTPITVGQDGQAEVSVTLPVQTPAGGDYVINVHESPSEMGTIVACGPLTTAGGK